MATVAEILGTKYPLIQGSMARISRHELVIGVSNAGGLGVLTSAGFDKEGLREEIRKVKAVTDKPFAVNLMLMMKNIPEMVEVIIEEEVPFVMTGAGTPKPYMPALTEAGIKVIPVIPSVKLAKKMEDLGAVAVAAEGMESGGHVGETTTMALVPQVASAVNIPVIAAGGIGDGRGVAAVYTLGAQGIQAGTIFLTADETPVPDAFKQAEILHIARADLEELSLGSLSKAVFEGDVENGSVMAGEISGMVNSKRSVKDIIEGLFNEAEEVVNNLKITY